MFVVLLIMLHPTQELEPPANPARFNPSVGTVGDSCDNALAESVIGLFKTEVIKQLGPWKNLQYLEWETMHWVDRYSTERLHGAIGCIPPAEAELRHLEPPETIGMVA